MRARQDRWGQDGARGCLIRRLRRTHAQCSGGRRRLCNGERVGGTPDCRVGFERDAAAVDEVGAGHEASSVRGGHEARREPLNDAAGGCAGSGRRAADTRREGGDRERRKVRSGNVSRGSAGCCLRCAWNAHTIPGMHRHRRRSTAAWLNPRCVSHLIRVGADAFTK